MSIQSSNHEREFPHVHQEVDAVLDDAPKQLRSPESLLGLLLEDMNALKTETWLSLSKIAPLRLIEMAITLENGTVTVEDLDNNPGWYEVGMPEELRRQAYIEGVPEKYSTFSALANEARRMDLEFIPVLEMIKKMQAHGRLELIESSIFNRKLAVTDRQIFVGLLALSNAELDQIENIILATSSGTYK